MFIKKRPYFLKTFTLFIKITKSKHLDKYHTRLSALSMKNVKHLCVMYPREYCQFKALRTDTLLAKDINTDYSDINNTHLRWLDRAARLVTRGTAASGAEAEAGHGGSDRAEEETRLWSLYQRLQAALCSVNNDIKIE